MRESRRRPVDAYRGDQQPAQVERQGVRRARAQRELNVRSAFDRGAGGWKSQVDVVMESIERVGVLAWTRRTAGDNRRRFGRFGEDSRTLSRLDREGKNSGERE